MIDEKLRQELLSMEAEDLRVREELLESGELMGHYVPRMEEVHVRNATRLKQIIVAHGWPGEDVAGREGAEAAWLVLQHSIGDPVLQKQGLVLLREAGAAGRVPRWHAAYLEDRIALYEGRAQRFGTQWLDDAHDGRSRPWLLADAGRTNELREGVGLKPLPEIPPPGPELPPGKIAEMRENERWWKNWLASKGWTQQRDTAQ